jgi:hypothetical protein
MPAGCGSFGALVRRAQLRFDLALVGLAVTFVGFRLAQPGEVISLLGRRVASVGGSLSPLKA